MKKFLKQIIKCFLSKNIRNKISYIKSLYNKYNKKYKNGFKTNIRFLLSAIVKTRVIDAKNEKSEQVRKAKMFQNICKNIDIDIDLNENYIYFIDVYKTCMKLDINANTVSNITVNYGDLIKTGTQALKNILNNRLNNNLNQEEKDFIISQCIVLDAINIICERILKELENLNEKENNSKVEELIDIFKNIPYKPARNLNEAIQFYLIINMLIWQEGHLLVGLGRLDKLFYDYYRNDMANGILDDNRVYELFKSFFKILNKYYWFKSSVLPGDTGQVIILGGKNIEGKSEINDLTYIILKVLKDLKLPDPKIVLRVHKDMPEDIMQCSIDCLKEGLGYPLFSNDEVIIPLLINYGYFKEDAYNYGTSACWEPFIIGKSLDQNNIYNINFLEPLNQLLKDISYNKTKIRTYEDFLDKYFDYLSEHINKYIVKSIGLKWERSPLLSLLIEGCIEKQKDISCGGAVYNNYGFLTVALSNAVNSILNIKKYAYNMQLVDIKEIYNILKNNFVDNDILLMRLKNNETRYGRDDIEIYELTNKLINIVSQTLNNKRNNLGGMFKAGLSSPNYINDAGQFPASFDGRREGEPFGVHISASGKGISYVEVSSFASKLNYGPNMFNGNVVDIIVEPNIIDNNSDKFIDYLLQSFDIGVFQMQMNVVNYKTLLEAKENPEKFPDLIVRVWGFSAYFNDLPEEYKNLLIERAMQYATVNN